MKKVLRRLDSDWCFIGEFLNNPKSTLQSFHLTAGERQALTARNPNALMALGLEQSVVNAALSGAHSMTCTTRF